ncbi:T/G mismatch-specific endonuclease [Bacteroides luti]|uniref:Very short patch repair endonuclease n=1 Tax=Bacteroides luti TaxID=1297750 RepID=A0A1M4Y0K2_9BACE|nr:very short patch repair endonuclease [Bacteroides luti]SHE99215.1 T/G mismatch-specific endonuclease [Bacteroides luti]
MPDVHSKETRSYNMSMIKGKNTKPEMIVRKYLFSKGFRYRVNVKELPGKPDIVLRKYRTVIFINGCFWHGHEGCKYFVMPKTRTEWWSAKIDKNIARDNIEKILLRKNGWHVMVLWECQLKPKKREGTLSEVVLLLEKTLLELYKK